MLVLYNEYYAKKPLCYVYVLIWLLVNGLATLYIYLLVKNMFVIVIHLKCILYIHIIIFTSRICKRLTSLYVYSEHVVIINKNSKSKINIFYATFMFDAF